MDLATIYTLKRLSDSTDNRVADLVLKLSMTKYPETARGYREAIADAIDQTAELNKQASERRPGVTLQARNRIPLGESYSRLLNQAGIVGQVWPGRTFGIPNKPGPLASMLALGLLGAGTGHLGGKGMNWLAGGKAPGLAKRMAMLGGAIGTLPGWAMAAGNMNQGKSPFFGDTFAVPMRKESMWGSQPQMIPVEGVHDLVWKDPFVARDLPPTLAAATSAVVEGASRVGNKQTSLPFVTPSDVGRMAVGMGSGYASGVIAGKALGALFGVSEDAQKILRRSGAAAGLLRTVIPTVFGA